MADVKEIYFDTETTGLNSKTSSIIQFAGYIRINKKVYEKFNFKIKPWEQINESMRKSTEIHGISIDEMMSYEDEKIVYPKIVAMFDKYIDKYNPRDKLVPVGQNIKFDIDMLFQLFYRQGDKYLGSYLNFSKRKDLLPLIQTLRAMGKITLDNSKLETICKHFNVEFRAHDAFDDIIATGKVFDILEKKLVLNS